MRCRQRRFHHDMAAARNREGVAVVDLGTDMALADGKFGERGGDVEDRQRFGDARQHLGRGQRLARHLVEQFFFYGERLIGGLRDAVCERREFVGRKAHGAAHRLAMAIAGGHQFVGVPTRDFDEIAQHAVMLDLERRAAFFAIARFERGDHPARFVAQRAHFVERRMGSRPHEAAVAGVEGGLLHQKMAQLGVQT